MALRELLVELGIEVDDDNAEQVIENLRKGFQRMGQSADKASKKTAKRIKEMATRMRNFQNAIMAAGAAFIGSKLTQGLFSMIDAASDAAEISNKLGAVFQEQTPYAEKFGSELADRIGQSRIQIQQMTADVGALVKPLMGSSGAALDMAKSVTELSFDIASFENVRPEDALNAMRSALIGSSEPMLAFGVDTRAAALEAFRLELGIKKSVKEMKQSQITSLRLALIQKRLGEKGAVGDATKTADGFANRTRALAGALQDLKAEIGKEFLPTAAEMVKAMIDLIKTIGPGLGKAAKFAVFVFRGLIRVLQLVIRIVVGFAKALTSAEGIVIVLIGAITGLTIAFKTVGAAAIWSGIKAAAAWVVATAPILLMIVLLGIIIATIVLVVEDLFAMGEGAESVSGTMIQGFLDLVEELGSIPAAIWEMLKTALAFWLEFFGMARDEAEIFADNLVTTLSETWDNAVAFWRDAWNSYVEWANEVIETAVDSWVGIFGSVFDKVVEVWKAYIEPFFKWYNEKISGAVGFVSGLFGGGEGQGQPGRPAGGVRENLAAAGPAVGAVAAGNFAGGAPMTYAAPGAGNRTMVNQPRTNINVDVNASGSSSSADDIASAVSREVESAMERKARQEMQAFTVQLEAG